MKEDFEELVVKRYSKALSESEEFRNVSIKWEGAEELIDVVARVCYCGGWLDNNAVCSQKCSCNLLNIATKRTE